MLYSELGQAIAPLETVGFKIQAAYPHFHGEAEYHKVDAYLQDPQSFVVLNIALKAAVDCPIDAYSVIKYCVPDALRELLELKEVLTEEDIVPFLVGHLVGDCARVFRVIDRTQWLELYAFQHESLRHRNEVFWAAVSGYRDQYSFKSRRKYTQEPKSTW